MKTIIISYMGIGDNFMFFRALLFYEWKEDELFWVVKPEFRNILQQYFPKSKIIVFEFNNNDYPRVFHTIRIIKYLRAEKIENAIILDYKTKPIAFFLLFLFFTGIKNIHYTSSEALHFLNKDLIKIKHYENKHEVNRYSDLLKFFLTPTIGSKANLFSLRLVGNESIYSDEKMIIIAPGSFRKAKRWSINNFIELAKKFANLGYLLVFVGGVNDSYLIQIIDNSLSDYGIKNFIGKLSFIETGRWIKRSKLLVSNDSAVMHYADLIGKPVVALFGITDPKRCGPYTQIKNCITNESYYPKYSYGSFPDEISDRFINEIKIDEVFERVLKILNDAQN